METSKKEEIQEGSDKVYIGIYKEILHQVVNEKIDEQKKTNKQNMMIDISDLFFSSIGYINQLESSSQAKLLQMLEKDLEWDKLSDEQKKSKGDALKKQLADPKKVAKYVSVIFEKANFIFASLSLFGASLASSNTEKFSKFYKIKDVYKYFHFEEIEVHLPLFFMMMKIMDDKLEYNDEPLTEEYMRKLDEYLIGVFKKDKFKLTSEEINKIKEEKVKKEREDKKNIEIEWSIDFFNKNHQFFSESSHESLRKVAREIVLKCLKYQKEDSALIAEKIKFLSQNSLVKDVIPVVFHCVIRALIPSCEENDLKFIIERFNEHFGNMPNKGGTILKATYDLYEILNMMVEDDPDVPMVVDVDTVASLDGYVWSVVGKFREFISGGPLLEAVILSNKDRVNKLKYLYDLFFSANEERHSILVSSLRKGNLLQQNDIEILTWYKNEFDKNNFIDGLHQLWMSERDYGGGSWVAMLDYEKIKLAFNFQEKNSKEELLKFVEDNTDPTVNKFKRLELIFDLSLRTGKEEDWIDALRNLLKCGETENIRESYAYSRFAAEAVIRGDLQRLEKFWEFTESIDPVFKTALRQRLLVDSTWAFHQAVRDGKQGFIDFFISKVSSLPDEYNLLYGLDFYSSGESQQDPVFNAVMSRNRGVLNTVYNEMHVLFNDLSGISAENQEYSLIREVEATSNKDEKKQRVLTKLKDHIEKKDLSLLAYIPMLYGDVNYLKQLIDMHSDEGKEALIKTANVARRKLGLPDMTEEGLGITKPVREHQRPVVEGEDVPPLAKQARKEWPLSNITPPELCLPGPSGYHQPPGRSKRNVLVEGCEISWKDVHELSENKEEHRVFSKIKINSDKLLDRLRDPATSEIKRAQLLHLADKVSISGKSKEAVEALVKHQKTLMYLQKLGSLSGRVAQGMMVKNIIGDLAQGNYEGVAINLGFIAGGQGFAKVAEVSSVKGMQLALNGQRLLGQSLRLASPFLARCTSAFIVYDLVNQINAYREGNPDAVVGIIGDSIYLGIDGIEMSIELAEVGGLLEGVSSVTGPIGMTVGAVVFVGTDVYLAVKQVNRLDALIHLTTKEKFVEGLRAFVGMNPERYIERLLGEKQGNTDVFNQGINFLKSRPNISRYILPTVKEVCMPRQSPADFLPHANRPRIGVDNLSLKNCNLQLEMNLNNTILLDNKKKDIKWSRTKPDGLARSLFCAPVGDELEIPSEGAYLCGNAMGIEWHDARTGNITLFELGDGNDIVVGFSQGEHVVRLGNGRKIIVLGDGNDVFLLTGNLLSGSVLQGGGGINTLDLAPHVQLSEALKAAMQIHNYLLRENESDYVPSVACSIHYIDARGGRDDDRGRDIIIISDACAYSLKVAVRSHTHIQNYSGNIENQFTYLIPTTINKGNSIISLENSEGSHQFVFAYGLSDINQLAKSNNTLNFVFTNGFSLHITQSASNNVSFTLGDNTEIKLLGDNFYAFQTSNHSLDDLVKEYPRIAQHLNLSIFVQLSLTNESLAIGHAKHDVLSNDPVHRSHLIGNGGENIFVIRSGYNVLDGKQLPLPEVILYDKDEQNLIDTLDLREIKAQLKGDLDVEIQVKTSLDKNDILLALFAPTLLRDNLVNIRLKDALLTNWHRRLHISLDHAPMLLDGLDLIPLPLEFGSDKAIIIISPEDIEENTKVMLSKKRGDYHYYRLGDSLILSNALDSNVTDSERYAVSLQNFYRTPKLETLSIQFADRKLELKREVTKIHNAKDFALECERYNQTLHEMLCNKNTTEETLFLERRSSREIHHERVEQEENKNVWERLGSYMLPLLGGAGAVVGVGLGYRNQMRRRLRANPVQILPQAAVAAVPLLVPTIEAKNEKSDSGGDGHFIGDFSSNLVSNFSLLKYLLHPFWPSIVEQMNEAERVANTRDSMDSMSSLVLAEQRVVRALKSYDVVNETNSFEEMIAFQDKSAVRTKSKDTSGTIGKNIPTTFFRPVSVSSLLSNDSCINDSRIEQPLLSFS